MSGSQRIVSFLPSATEMVCALGLIDRLVGITHECDYPPAVRDKPVVVRNALPIETMTQAEIDVAVSERLRSGDSLYQIDEELLRELAPDLILTQDLCQVCAPSGHEVSQVLEALPAKTEILWMTPKSIDEIFQNIRDLGAATERNQEAEMLIAKSRERLAHIQHITKELSRRPRVFCMEWIDPIYCSGHWVPEMVSIAGGVDELGKKGSDSVRIDWQDIVEWRPEVMIIMPCGFKLDEVVEKSPHAMKNRDWLDLPAARNNQVYAVDANSYFARPGPRVVEGTELLAHLMNPAVFVWNGSPDAYMRLDFSSSFAESVAG